MDFKVKEYVIIPYVSDMGVERIWFANYKWSGRHRKRIVGYTIQLGQKEWVKINWEQKEVL